MEDAKQKNRNRRRIIALILVVIIVATVLLLLSQCQPTPPRETETARAPSRLVTLQLGDLVTTGFSGIATDDLEAESVDMAAAADRHIDIQGPSARIYDASSPGFVWDGRYWSPPVRATARAIDVGQVFSIAIDDARRPNLYLAATSAYGLNLVVQPDPHEPPERAMRGAEDAFWMPGQFGPRGGPGSIWRVDGRTGRITRFADISLNGRPTGPASLGGLAYAAQHNQLFVSDLSTGMIHRLSLEGQDLEVFDHGETGRRAAGLGRVAHRPGAIPSIRDREFDTGDPGSWGFAPAERRVTALRVRGDRLYYAVQTGPEIWSVGLRRGDPETPAYEGGEFLDDARRELVIPDPVENVFIATIEFNNHGDMILAERAMPTGEFGFQGLVEPVQARVHRFWREDPDIPATPGQWSPQAEEHAVGYPGSHRNSSGGATLGYGYDAEGQLAFSRCESAIWTTGDNLRGFEPVDDGFAADGPLMVHGVQGSPADWARPFNTPPLASYFVDFDNRLSDAPRRGHSGAALVYRLPCGTGGRTAASGAAVILPPGSTVTPPAGGGYGGPGSPTSTGSSSTTGSSTGSTTNTSTSSGGSPTSTSTSTSTSTTTLNTDISITNINSWLNVDVYICEIGCIGPDCDNGSGGGEQCMAVQGQFQCDAATGQWVYNTAIDDVAGAGIDALRAYSHTAGVSLAGGPDYPMTPAPGQLAFDGLDPGESVVVEMCGFNSSAAASGEPYDCCWQTQVLTAPTEACPIP